MPRRASGARAPASRKTQSGPKRWPRNGSAGGHLLGGPDQVRRFVERAMSRLDAPLEPAKADTARAHLAALPSAVSERLAARGLAGSVRLAFAEPAPAGAEMIGRNHPLPATLAEALLEGALDPGSSAMTAARARRGVAHRRRKTLTTILLLRLRHKLTVQARRERLLLAEEAGALAFEADAAEPKLVGEAALGIAGAPGRRRSRPGRARAVARAGPRADRSHVLGCRSRPMREARAEALATTMPASARHCPAYRGSASSRYCRSTSSASTSSFRPGSEPCRVPANRAPPHWPSMRLTVEGALIAPAMLARIAEQKAGGQAESDYNIPKGLTLRDEIARYFRIGQALFTELSASADASAAATIRFVEALLRDVFGFGDISRVGTRILGERTTP